MNKKLIYAPLALAACAFVACDNEDYSDWAEAQSNDPETAQTASYTVASAAETFNFAVIADEDTLTLFTPTIVAEDGATATYSVVLSDAEGVETNVESVTISASDGGKVIAGTLREAVETLYGKNPALRTLTGTVVAYVDIDGQTIKCAASTITVKVTLDAPYIASAYYLVGNMTGSGSWSEDDLVQFSHSDSDVYDDPEFTIVFETTAADQYWKIIPSDYIGIGNIWGDNVVGVAIDGDSSLSGSLVNEGANAGKIEEAAMYRMVINMMDYTYTLTKLDFTDYLYIAGTINDWKFIEKIACSNNDGYYTGFAELGGEYGFKFSKDGTWDTEYTAFNTLTNATGGNGNNIMCEDGFYYIDANLVDLELTLTPITSISLIGSVVNGDSSWGTDADMTLSDDYQSWTYTGALTAGEFKFRMNYEWTINLGGETDDLEVNGANLKIDEDGTYTVTLYPTRSGSDKIYCTIEKN